MEMPKRIIDLTVDELRTLILELVGDKVESAVLMIESRLNREQEVHKGARQGKGLRAICKALGCGESKAKQLKAQGLLDGGYRQDGRIIIVPDMDALPDILAHNREKQQKAKRGNRVHYAYV